MILKPNQIDRPKLCRVPVRCGFADYVPRRVDDDCLQEPRWLHDRRDLPEARRDLAAWLAKWSGKYSKLTGWVEENIDETLTFYTILPADIGENRTRLSWQKSRLVHVMSNKRIKLLFRVAVALVIVGGYQPTVRSHLPRFPAISRPPRILCVSPTFIRI